MFQSRMTRMPNYTVRFAHQDETQDDAFGWGEIEIETDLEVTTDEQMLEIARTIGRDHGFTKVGILKIEETQVAE